MKEKYLGDASGNLPTGCWDLIWTLWLIVGEISLVMAALSA